MSRLAAQTHEVAQASDGETARASSSGHARAVLAAATLGFFVITLDAVVVNVTLPTIRADLGGGVAGLQWIIDGYTLIFAALLLTAGSFTDRIGARRAFGFGVVIFALASIGCASAPSLGALIGARLVQGAAAAAMMPSSMALIRQAFPESAQRARSIGIWAMGGAVASTSGPLLGGLLTSVDWRLVFVVNVPVAVVTLILVSRSHRSPRRSVPFDLSGQLTGVVGLGSLTFGTIEAGSVGLADLRVLVAFAVGLLGILSFVRAEHTSRHPMMPLALFRSRTVVVAVLSGFAFMVGYYGLPFVISLSLQQERGLSPLGTGTIFLPMMIIGAVLTPFSARIAERVGRQRLIVCGLLLMTTGWC